MIHPQAATFPEGSKPEPDAPPTRAPGSASAGWAARPWWLWPHLLSLDAPLVAWVWQRWWAGSAHVALRPAQEGALALGVWLIYLADRLADTRGGPHGIPPTARHAFCRMHWRALCGLAIAVMLAEAALTLACLGAGEFRAGLGLLALATGYFWRVHCQAPRGTGGLPKEAFVATIFAAGTVFFVAGRVPWIAGLACAVPGFAALCFLNCALITRWERNPEDLRDPASLLNAFPGLTRGLGRGCAALAVLSLALAAATRSPAALPVAAGALLLAALDYQRAAFSPAARRVLADATLLAPALWWLAGWGR